MKSVGYCGMQAQFLQAFRFWAVTAQTYLFYYTCSDQFVHTSINFTGHEVND